MKRELTNKIRFVLDELIPPIIRDNRWFMWPFYVLAYGKLSVNDLMDFKSRVYSMTDSEYAKFYGSLGNSMSRRRLTDLNTSSIDYLLDKMPKEIGGSALDVGAGNGYLLERIAAIKTWSRVAGVDVVPSEKRQGKFEVFTGARPNLPFKDKEFNVVTCTHVMEHLLDPAASAKELLRITQNVLFIVVPRQRYYYYTLDEHINFYPQIEPLIRLFEPYNITVSLQEGDWVLMIDLD
jgi:ubiquinone/menaquinone biosynthesis C-methylase UbiE